MPLFRPSIPCSARSTLCAMMTGALVFKECCGRRLPGSIDMSRSPCTSKTAVIREALLWQCLPNTLPVPSAASRGIPHQGAFTRSSTPPSQSSAIYCIAESHTVNGCVPQPECAAQTAILPDDVPGHAGHAFAEKDRKNFAQLTAASGTGHTRGCAPSERARGAAPCTLIGRMHSQLRHTDVVDALNAR
ncbi:hypothetical protein FKP32DRAFT_752404 [Trametes sanguinea]|nr:hypothetical protein FKP32DRAFT_752404 [Trametes sanguinea]